MKLCEVVQRIDQSQMIDPEYVHQLVGHSNFSIEPNGVRINGVFYLPKFLDKMPFPLAYVEHFKIDQSLNLKSVVNFPSVTKSIQIHTSVDHMPDLADWKVTCEDFLVGNSPNITSLPQVTVSKFLSLENIGASSLRSINFADSMEGVVLSHMHLSDITEFARLPKRLGNLSIDMMEHLPSYHGIHNVLKNHKITSVTIDAMQPNLLGWTLLDIDTLYIHDLGIEVFLQFHRPFDVFQIQEQLIELGLDTQAQL